MILEATGTKTTKLHTHIGYKDPKNKIEFTSEEARDRYVIGYYVSKFNNKKR
jgi:hypothetical protein